MHCEFLISAPTAAHLPKYDLPEIAFVGRSNCGKSSLLNSLLGRKNLARTSQMPGRTQMANFFSVNGKLIFVDLPGYGFAAAHEKTKAPWQKLVDAYLQRENLREVLFLIDGRRQPDGEDLGLMDLIGRHLPISIIVTKIDKMNRVEAQKAVENLKSLLVAEKIAWRRVVGISSLKKTGIEELRAELLAE